MKRLWLIAISVLFGVAGVAALSVVTSSNGYFLGVPIRSAVRIERHLKGKSEEEPDISRLSFGGNPVPYDQVTNTVFIPADMDNEGWDGILTTEEGRLLFLKDELLKSDKKKQAIAEGASFELYSIYGSTFSKVNVVMTGVPVISIDKWYDISKEHWSGSIQIFDPTQTGSEYQATVCDYYIRGQISRSYEKKSYKVVLSDEKLSLCGLRKDDDWILNALYDDCGLVRNMISYRLWNEVAALNDVPNDDTVECVYVELILDNEYMGAYLLSDRLDRKKLDLSKKDILYKQKDLPQGTSREELASMFSIIHPNDYGDKEIDVMVDLMDTIFNDPEDIGLSYEEFTDQFYMENIIDYNLFCLLLSAGDNLFNNSFIVAIHQSDGGYRFKEIPWDLNGTFGLRGGRMWFGEDRIEEISDLYPLLGQTMRDLDRDAFYEECAKRWKELRKSVFSEENIRELAEEYIKYTEDTGLYGRNLERWPIFQRDDEEPTPLEELWKKEDLFRFIEERPKVLDEYFEAGSD